MKQAHKHFFSRLNYSFGNEDWRVERKALNIQPTDNVLCITASGDRPLHLLMDPCAKIVSVDLNKTQNFLLSLKVHAMRHLPFNDYLSFLGAIPQSNRLSHFKKLLPKLETDCRKFWHSNQKLIVKGILYQGAMEKACKKVAFCAKLMRGKKIQRLFEFDDLAKQQAFVNEEWNSYLWKKSFQFVLNPRLMRYFLRDPGMFAYLGESITPADYINGRMNNSLQRSLAKENPLISLILRGHVAKEAFPPYLTKDGCDIIKKRLGKLTWKHDNYITYLEKAPAESFDCFSVSDIASYMNEESFERLLRAIYRVAKPNARFSIRQLMSAHAIPEDLKPHFKRNSSLENELEEEDYCFVYRFIAGTIDK